jgi:hypothetical protein
MLHRHIGSIFIALTLLAASPDSSAHHAGIAYDHGNQVVLSGTVKEFQWTNPHTWIMVMVPDGKGAEEQWPLEGTSINTLVRAGWTIKTLQAGMKVKILVSPRKDGTPGGEWNKVIAINEVPFTPPVAQQ